MQPRLLLSLVFTFLHGASIARAEEPNSPLLPIGAAVVDITPEYPIRLAGYASRTKESEGVVNKLRAHALAIGDDTTGDGPALIITVDNVSVASSITDEVAANLKTKRGVKRERIAICASHTHSGPFLSTASDTLLGELPAVHVEHIQRYTRELTLAIENVALKALDARSPGRLAWGQGHVGFAGNRRILRDGRWVGFGLNPNGPVDQSLPILSVTDPGGKPRAIVFGYTCHCTCMPGEFNQICGDWAGFACEEIEAQNPGALALAVIGCAGDSGPQPAGKVEDARRHGAEIAKEVARLLKTSLKPLSGKIAARSRQIELPLQAAPTKAELEPRTKKPGSEGYFARKLIAQLDRGEPLAKSIPYPVSTWCFDGDLAMVFLAGEVVIDYALRLKWEIDANRLWISAYTNDARCYVASRRVLNEGGYEADFSMVLYGQPAKLAPEAEDLLIRTVHDLLPPPFDEPRKP
ncbi:neutral/alkaline non-lysosomal ceramidase N-terminal domain-containing protein [Singulisphaera sp. PoT]|uniref:neutral/alkaline non-lysosomal ceramidase N-terminal domain-containing protein n=1 Tax=Singulisphaera sp. PoT TaxID=3411797 RepID=UPI003BF60C91